MLIRLLKQVALELQNIIDIIDTREQNYYVSKHYSTRLTYRYTGPGSELLSYPEKESMPKVIKQYYLENLVSIENYLDEELKNAKYTFDNFSNTVHSS
jgi:hypothetical protein